MQVCVTHELKGRLIYYLTRLFAGQLHRGEPYALLERAVSLIIVGDILSPEEEGYYNRYRILNQETAYEFSNLLELNILELGKLPAYPDKREALWNWGRFFVSKTEEELRMAGERDAVIGETVVRLVEMSADERERELAEAREKWLWDQAAMRRTGYAEGEARGIQLGEARGIQLGEAIGEARLRETARKLKQLGLPLDQIAQATGLSVEELAAL
jgi:predicted transposase/invertase (TIGR01784 family)